MLEVDEICERRESLLARCSTTKNSSPHFDVTSCLELNSKLRGGRLSLAALVAKWNANVVILRVAERLRSEGGSVGKMAFTHNGWENLGSLTDFILASLLFDFFRVGLR